MKIHISISITALFLNGCNPDSHQFDKENKQSYREILNLADECVQLVKTSQSKSLAELKRRDPWNTPYRVLLAEHPPDTIVIVVGAGPDGVYHTGDDIVETRSVRNYVRPAEQD